MIGGTPNVLVVNASLPVNTVAEFVETAAIHEGVKRIGVDFVQGFHFGRPRPLGSVD